MESEIFPFFITDIQNLPFLVVSLLRVVAQRQPIQHDPKCPDIGLEGVIILPKNQLRCHILRSASNHHFIKFLGSGKSKINNFHIYLVVDQNVLGFYVSVRDSKTV